MGGRVEGQAAFVTWEARGQGRSHATRPAREDADSAAIHARATIPGRGAPLFLASGEARCITGTARRAGRGHLID
jgi:hypothetical protein